MHPQVGGIRPRSNNRTRNFWMLSLLDFFSFREYIFGVVCCGHACARGSMLKIGDGYRLRAWHNHYKFYDSPF